MNKPHDRNQRQALGKGLSALLPSRPIVVQRPEERPAQPQSGPSQHSPQVLPEKFEAFESIPLDQITAGAGQPREMFDEAKLMELAQSITANGLLQPITVQKSPDGKYRIIAGERRWRASKLAGLKQIPALVRPVEEGQDLQLALIENIQREDLNPIEVAGAFHRLATEHGMSHEQIAERTGKDRSTVTNLLRLLKLGAFTQGELRKGTITMGHARALLNIVDETSQTRICHQVMARKLSVRETEAYVKKLTQEQESSGSAPEKEAPKVDPNIRAALDEMAMALGTKVSLTPRKLEIEYYSPEDLERIYSVIVRQ